MLSNIGQACGDNLTIAFTSKDPVHVTNIILQDDRYDSRRSILAHTFSSATLPAAASSANSFPRPSLDLSPARGLVGNDTVGGLIERRHSDPLVTVGVIEFSVGVAMGLPSA